MTFVLGITYATLAAITWGINSHILHRGAQNEHPFMALVYRAIVSLPILILLTLVFRSINAFTVFFDPFNLLMSFFLILTIVVGDGIFIYSMKKYPVSVILPIATSYPLITTIILITTGLEAITILIGIGTIAVVVGIYMVTRFRYNEDNIRTGVNLEATFLGLGVALGWGLSVIFARIILNQSGTESFGLMTVRTAMIGLVAAMVFFSNSANLQQWREQPKESKVQSFKIFGLSGIFGWVLGATFLFLALEEINAAIATPISASNPIIAVIIGQLSGIDKINLKQFLGICVTTVGVILIML